MSAQGDARIVLAATLGLACVAMCLVAVTDFHGAREVPVTLTSGWGVRGVAEMASHVNAEKGWNLGADAAEEDTGYLHMFSSPVSQLAKAAAQADNTDCLEHDCPGGGASPAAHHESEEREEAQQEKEEEAQIARQARTMNKFAKLGFAKQHSALVPRAFHPKKKALKHGEHGEHGHEEEVDSLIFFDFVPACCHHAQLTPVSTFDSSYNMPCFFDEIPEDEDFGNYGETKLCSMDDMKEAQSKTHQLSAWAIILGCIVWIGILVAINQVMHKYIAHHDHHGHDHHHDDHEHGEHGEHGDHGDAAKHGEEPASGHV
mmetsp:Transcript_29807/g.70833  ORF Transcript_29807/g.70833 Transcript_29807/m.70833 type:complete len:316 (+) Transcript_29807:3-950(+)